MKKIIALFLAMLMMFTSIPVTAFAAQKESAQIELTQAQFTENENIILLDSQEDALDESSEQAPAEGKSKTTALLLCIFLGQFGAHRFYVGKTGTAVLYLFTLGLVHIGQIIDIVKIATGEFTDKNENALV